jgi:hypothetical protein
LDNAFCWILKEKFKTAFSKKSTSLPFASRCQKLLREILSPVRLIKFLWASAIAFFLEVTVKVETKATTSSKRGIFFPVESVHLYPGFFGFDLFLR